MVDNFTMPDRGQVGEGKRSLTRNMTIPSNHMAYIATPQLFRAQSPRNNNTTNRFGHTKSDPTVRVSPEPDGISHKVGRSLEARSSGSRVSPVKTRISEASSSSSRYPTEKSYRDKIMKLEEQLRRAILGHDKALQEKRKSEQHRQSLLYQLDGETQRRQDVEIELEELLKKHDEQVALLKEKYARKGNRIEQTFQNHQMLSERYDQLTREKGTLLDKLAKQAIDARSLHQILRSFIDRIWQAAAHIGRVEKLSEDLSSQVYERHQEIISCQHELANLQEEFSCKENDYNTEVQHLQLLENEADCRRFTLSRCFSAWRSHNMVVNRSANIFLSRTFRSWLHVTYIEKERKQQACGKLTNVLKSVLKRQEARRSALATSLPTFNGIEQLKTVLERPIKDTFRTLQMAPLQMESTILHDEVCAQQEIQQDLQTMKHQHEELAYQMEQLRLQRDELRSARDSKTQQVNEMQANLQAAQQRIEGLHNDLLTAQAAEAEIGLQRQGLVRRCEQDRLLLDKVTTECDAKVAAFEQQLATFAQKCGMLHHEAMEAKISEQRASAKLSEYGQELDMLKENVSRTAEDEAARVSQKLHQANIRATVAQEAENEAKEMVAKLQEELEECREEMQNLHRQEAEDNAQASQKLKETKVQLERQIDDVAAHQKQLDRQKVDWHNREQQLSTQEQQLAHRESQLREDIDRLQELHDELSKKESEVEAQLTTREAEVGKAEKLLEEERAEFMNQSQDQAVSVSRQSLDSDVESVKELSERLEEAYQVILKYQKKVQDLEKDLTSECARSDKLHRDYTLLLESRNTM